ncbi:MAG: hypothetical protein QXP39_03175, partial [Candidatus Aenigmatarchaeota archaeon]
LEGSHSNNVSYLRLYDNNVDLINDATANNYFSEITFTNTKVSFNYSGTFNMTSYLPSSTPSGMASIGKGLKIENSAFLELNITFFYSDSDLSNIKSEGSLALYRLNGTWQKVPGQVLNTASNTISVTLNEFSNFAIFGEKKPSEGGVYYGGHKLSVVCGDGICNSLYENYLNCSLDCPIPLEPPKNITKNLGDVSTGLDFVADTGEVFIFRVKGQEHTAQVGIIGENNIILFIWSTPLKVELIIGEPKQLDLDGDNSADLEILLKKIENKKAVISFAELKEEVSPVPTAEKEEERQQVIEEKPSPIPIWLPLVIIFVILIAAVALFLNRSKSLKKHK